MTFPESVTHSGWAPHTDLHLAGSFSNHIVYRNGQEVLDLQPGSPGAKLKNESLACGAGLVRRVWPGPGDLP
jgi:hypothetical protein